MGKIIIHNRTDISDLVVLDCVSRIINMGRVSKNRTQYCYLSAFTHINDKEYHIVTDLRKRSDVFIFYEAHK